MRPVVTDVCVSVGQITMSDATTAEPMEMPFGAWTSVGPMNFVFLVGARIPPGEATHMRAPRGLRPFVDVPWPLAIGLLPTALAGNVGQLIVPVSLSVYTLFFCTNWPFT